MKGKRFGCVTLILFLVLGLIAFGAVGTGSGGASLTAWGKPPLVDSMPLQPGSTAWGFSQAVNGGNFCKTFQYVIQEGSREVRYVIGAWPIGDNGFWGTSMARFEGSGFPSFWKMTDVKLGVATASDLMTTYEKNLIDNGWKLIPYSQLPWTLRLAASTGVIVELLGNRALVTLAMVPGSVFQESIDQWKIPTSTPQ